MFKPVYVANMLSSFPYAFKWDNNPITSLIMETWTLSQQRKYPLFVFHLQGHQGLPGFLSTGNQLADQQASQIAIVLYSSKFQKAKKFHRFTHGNWKGLQVHLKTIVRTCNSCMPFLFRLHLCKFKGLIQHD